ncbi:MULTISPECIES: phage tail tape measure protein [Hyphomicrobiales]|jgi:TP901 family phage tail tape measure protein|uniref:phage tail tape measure protein n=1 Tax=Methylobacterium sp. CCH7-A2 TaxID=1768789 RepID=UPI0008311572|nr:MULTISPECIES: phage tail tape measure protein [Hyphomicrobiales]
MATHTSTLAIKLLDGVSGPAKGAAASLGAITKATEALGKVKGLREQTARLDEMSRAHAKARENVRNLAGQLLAAEAPSRKMQAAYERATAAADKLGNKLEWQKARVRGAASELERMGIAANNLAGAENRLQASIHRTTAAIQRQEAASLRSQARRAALGDAATVAGGVAAIRAKEIGKKAIVSAADFDIGVRRQRAYAGITKEDQDRLLIPQAKRIGQDTQFTNLDIVEAQTAIMQRLPEQLPRASVAQAITEEVKNYALSMRADMKTSAEGITAFLMQTGKDITTQDKAVAEARRASNMLVRMAKLGGMSDEDVSQFMKYAATSSTLAGLSNETLGALGVGLKRAGFRGDEAGVGIRSISAKLVSPGRKGLDALTAMGVDYNKFTTMPGGLSAENLEAMQKRRFGKTFNASQRERLTTVLEDDETLANKDAFIAKVSAIMQESFEKTKGGKTKAQDAQKIAKLAADFHQLGVASVDAEGLLAAILSAAPTLQQLNALFTDKQGGKAGALGKVFEQLGKDREAIRNTPDDFGKKIADEIMGGLGGSFERLKGSVENFYLALGEANSKLLSFSFDNIGSAIDYVSNLGTAARQAATAIGLIGAGYGAYRSAGLLASLVKGVTGGGSAAALTGSALALDGSAAALTAAAVKLGGAGVAGAAGAAATGAGAGAAGAAGGILGGVTVAGVAGAAALAAGIATIIANHKTAAAGVTRENAAPGQEHDWGQRRRRDANEAARQRILQTRREIEAIDGVGIDAGTDAGRAIPEAISSGITANGPKVEAAARGVLDRIRSLFGAGVDVPVRVMPSGVPASPAAPSSALPAPNRQSSVAPSIRNNVTINTGSGDPREIAAAVSRAVGEKTAESLRGAFSDNATG